MKLPDLSNIFKEAKEIQDKLKSAQNNLHNTIIHGESGAGLVKVTINGKHQIQDMHIDDELLSQPKTIIKELIVSAINDASNNLDKIAQEKFSLYEDYVNASAKKD